MASFVVLERASGSRPAPDGADRDHVIVRDGFTFLAFLVPPLWLLWHRMWIEALVAIAAVLAIAATGTFAGFGSASSWLSLLVSIFVGLEGANLRVARLRRQGWREWGVVEADNLADAETRYLAEAYSVETAAPKAGPWDGEARASARRGPALGMFAYPGDR